LTDRPSPVLADRMPCGMEGLEQGAVSRVATGDVDGCDGTVAHRVRSYNGEGSAVRRRLGCRSPPCGRPAIPRDERRGRAQGAPLLRKRPACSEREIPRGSTRDAGEMQGRREGRGGAAEREPWAACRVRFHSGSCEGRRYRSSTPRRCSRCAIGHRHRHASTMTVVAPTFVTARPSSVSG
jgi:hypothetical protein